LFKKIGAGLYSPTPNIIEPDLSQPPFYLSLIFIYKIVQCL